MQIMQSRRRFLTSLSLASAAGLVGAPRQVHAEPPPETTTVRLPKSFRAVCEAPKNVAGELLRAEGFTNVRWVEIVSGVDPSVLLANGELDFNYDFAPAHIASIDAGLPVTVLTGMHSGCLELIANESVHSITDLRSKSVGVDRWTTLPHILMSLMAAYVGLDPKRDIKWVAREDATAMQLFVDGKIDAFLGTPPEPQELRHRKIGHTILSSTVDPPWSHYFCCMLTAAADYVTKYPVATKRVLRAILKGADLCVSNPKWAAQRIVDEAFTDGYDYALQALTEARYDRWREYDPEDTLRFYALRMHEAGFIKSGPNEIIAAGTDWRFLDELKRELKT
jgi:NitT/TauT family transport system substrate-binding protein